MSEQEIRAMAREAGFYHFTEDIAADLIAFARLVEAKAKEENAAAGAAEREDDE
jgi:hypothetical protein